MGFEDERHVSRRSPQFTKYKHLVLYFLQALGKVEPTQHRSAIESECLGLASSVFETTTVHRIPNAARCLSRLAAVRHRTPCDKRCPRWSTALHPLLTCRLTQTHFSTFLVLVPAKAEPQGISRTKRVNVTGHSTLESVAVVSLHLIV